MLLPDRNVPASILGVLSSFCPCAQEMVSHADTRNCKNIPALASKVSSDLGARYQLLYVPSISVVDPVVWLAGYLGWLYIATLTLAFCKTS